MFNAESIIKIIQRAVLKTEADTTRAIADQLRKLPAGYPLSDVADTLDTVADELDGHTEKPVSLHWRHIGCPGGENAPMRRVEAILNPRTATVCSRCGRARDKLEVRGEVELV